MDGDGENRTPGNVRGGSKQGGPRAAPAHVYVYACGGGGGLRTLALFQEVGEIFPIGTASSTRSIRLGDSPGGRNARCLRHGRLVGGYVGREDATGSGRQEGRGESETGPGHGREKEDEGYVRNRKTCWGRAVGLAGREHNQRRREDGGDVESCKPQPLHKTSSHLGTELAGSLVKTRNRVCRDSNLPCLPLRTLHALASSRAPTSSRVVYRARSTALGGSRRYLPMWPLDMGPRSGHSSLGTVAGSR
ncbi:hypothetical protein GGS23DRAFT_576465 [Durotheca rogersii]|uniref:uncharacterized protein n=1 Tax=Durotheca rogersii TaxID=419775 RepID=UPI00221F1528|nr:uncharacterized protein GGS23DRAFT_576465 [Durotheca rogersii]KAI5861355.1 hypothetical protein GGS23DRAFT_576465 [Durotheca rogersii]